MLTMLLAPHSLLRAPRNSCLASWLIYWVLLCVLLQSSFSAIIPNLSPSEFQALNDIYTAAHGNWWIWKEDQHRYGIPWNFTSSLLVSNPCDDIWQGVTCRCGVELCVVTNLRLSDYNLTGTISDAIGDLTSLTELDFSFNINIAGLIPSSMVNLLALKIMNLEFNSLSGPIPEFLEKMTDVAYLYLSHNNITGSITDELCRMPSLVSLDMGNNHLTGSLPVALGLLNNTINSIDFSFNNLTGAIPEEISYLWNISFFHAAFNNLSSTIPASLALLPTLKSVDFSDNNLTGTIPFGRPNNNQSELDDVYLFNNMLTGTIPADLFNILILDLANNLLVGNLSGLESVGAVPLLELFLANNLLTGSIPNNINTLMPRLFIFTANGNLLSGTIPSVVCELFNLVELQLYENSFHETIPDCLGDLVDMNYLGLYSNSLTGTIPVSITNWSLCTYIDVGNNQLTGTIPAALGNINLLKYIYANQNSLTGPMPSLEALKVLGTLDISSNVMTGPLANVFTTMTFLSLHHNRFTGTIPLSYEISGLQVLFLNKNNLVGTLPSFDSIQDSVLTNIDFSDNQFTGNIQMGIFNLTTLETYAAVGNCITGSLSSMMCNAVNLQSLALDGLHTADSCQAKFFPSTYGVNNYYLTTHISGEIPRCLFNMTRLTTLHLSGNAISDHLANDMIISDVLQDLDLSHNNLYGGIPDNIQLRPWVNMDLSNNKINGFIHVNIPSPLPNASIAIAVNRLSGQVPMALHAALNISILNGNLFNCFADRGNLPLHDSDSSVYKCGSNQTDFSLFLWGAAAMVTIILLGSSWLINYRKDILCSAKVKLHAFIEKQMNHITIWSKIYKLDDDLVRLGYPELYFLGNLCRTLRTTFSILVAFIFFALMPIYTLMSHFVQTYSFQYVWSVSAIFTSGTTPGLVFQVASIGFLIVVFAVADRKLLQANSALMRGLRSRLIKIVVREDRCVIVTYYCKLLIILFLNLAVVIPANGVYVYVILTYGSTEAGLAEVIIASFKILWSDFFVRKMVGYIRLSYVLKEEIVADTIADTTHVYYMRELGERYLYSVLVLLNLIIIPCGAIMSVSSQCFRDVFVMPKTVVSSYSFQTCSRFLFSKRQGFVCVNDVSHTHSTTYQPPFMYSYECASYIVSSYAMIYIYTAIAIGFVLPLSKIISRVIFDDCTPGSFWHNTIARFLPLNIRHLDADISLYGVDIFDKDKFIMRVNSNLAILLTFGVLFPPLAVVQLSAMWSLTLYEQLVLGRLLHVAGKAKFMTYRRVVLRECRDTLQSLVQTLWLVMPTAAFFYAFLAFDMIGDDSPISYAIWAAVILILTPMMLYFTIMAIQYFNKDSQVYKMDMFVDQDFKQLVVMSSGRDNNGDRDRRFSIDSEFNSRAGSIQQQSFASRDTGTSLRDVDLRDYSEGSRPSVMQGQDNSRASIYQYQIETRKNSAVPASHRNTAMGASSSNKRIRQSLWTRGSSLFQRKQDDYPVDFSLSTGSVLTPSPSRRSDFNNRPTEVISPLPRINGSSLVSVGGGEEEGGGGGDAKYAADNL